MRYRSLGKTGFNISEIGFGGWAIAGETAGNAFGAADEATALAALHCAYELGCNIFSTADLYGHGRSESLLAQALKDWNRDKVIIATQGGQDFTQNGEIKPNFSEAYLRKALEASLKRLGIERVDLYQLQNPPMALIQHAGVFETLRKFKQEGIIRSCGVNIHDPQEGIQAIQLGDVDVIETVYNLFDTRAEARLLSLCEETRTGLIIREPLARGFLTDTLIREGADFQFEPQDVRAVWPKLLIQKRIQAARQFKPLAGDLKCRLSQLALAYPLSHPAVSTVTPDCKTPQEVAENLAAIQPPLSPDALEAIRQIQARL